MDNYQLHCFKIVAELQSVTNAARQLHISQPSLSQTIHRLEEELGYPLFNRYHKKIRLNETGILLYQKVCSMELFWENTINEMNEMNHYGKRVVTLHVSCASMLLPKLLLYLKDKYPMIEFRIYQWNEASNNDDKDLWLVAEPLSDADYVLLTEDFVLAMPISNSLAQKEKICLDDLRDESFIGLTDQWSLEKYVSQELKLRGFSPRITMRFDNPVLMREILNNEMGMAFVPSITWNYSAGKRIVMKKVADFNISRSIYLHMPKGFISKEQKICAEGIINFFDGYKMADMR